MGTGYVRKDTVNNIADGNIINASDLDLEFDGIVDAFSSTTGHDHDGTSGNGSPITKLGPTQDVVIGATAVTPKTDNTVDLGSNSLEFKDLFIDGTANIDSLVADTADINGGTIDGATIGGASAAAGTFTNVTASGTVNLTGATVSNGGSVTTVDINGGTIDGAAVGSASASTGAFTTLSSSSTTTLNGTTIPASKTLVTTADTQTITAKTISVDDNTISGIAATSFVLSNGSGNIDGSASQKAIPSGVVVGTTDTQTLSDKRINPRVVAASGTSGTITPNGDTTDVYKAEGLTGGITIAVPSGTPVDGQKLMIRLEDNGTARAITWTTSAGGFRAIGITLPTTTVATKITYVGCVYNSTDSFWDAVATVTEA
jgi:hypothetical protein